MDVSTLDQALRAAGIPIFAVSDDGTVSYKQDVTVQSPENYESEPFDNGSGEMQTITMTRLVPTLIHGATPEEIALGEQIKSDWLAIQLPIEHANNTARNMHALWAAATAYEQAAISGSATGFLTIGKLNAAQFPKCAACVAWVNSIWALYYSRKALVIDIPDCALLDFSSCGEMPHTIPELMAEAGL